VEIVATPTKPEVAPVADNQIKIDLAGGLPMRICGVTFLGNMGVRRSLLLFLIIVCAPVCAATAARTCPPDGDFT
jgi:hypothetical protein